MKPAFSLCVYCGSRPGKLESFTQTAKAVGEWIGQHKGQLVYGGGNNGLMGIVAAATQQAGGRVVGIIPHALAEMELARDDCDEFYLVDNMHQRKQMMAERADAFLALPGGIGTFEEFFEVWTWRQLGYHNKPIGLLNVDGYYDGLLTFMRTTVNDGFVSDWQMNLIQQSSNLEQLLPLLIQEAGLSEGKGLDAI
jgi:uncharacterized protein (TIGR00730 family)